MSSNGYNFSERVRRVLARSRDEAVRLHHEYVGTEHILLGIAGEHEGVACTVLEGQRIGLQLLKDRVLAEVKTGKPDSQTGPDLPYTSRAKKVLELAMAEARELSHSYVGTEHLLLGLIREERGIGAQVLSEAGLSYDTARTEVMKLLGTMPPRPSLEDSQHRFEASRTESPARESAARRPHHMPKAIRGISIDVFYEDGTVRRENFTSAMGAISFIGSVHRGQMDT